MKFNIGDIIYDGGANGIFCTFIKGRIKYVMERYYVVEILEDYGSVWEKPNTAKIGSLSNCLENSMFKTYKEAKENVYKDMKFKLDEEFIKYYFENSYN